MFSDWQSVLIDELRVARLATIGADGRSHLVPVCYAFVDGRVVIPVDEKPKTTTELARLKNIRRDPRVSLLFDRYDDDWAQLAWVRIEGEALVLAEGAEQPGALAALRARYSQYLEMDLERRPLVVVTPTRVSGWRWTDDSR